MHCRCFVGIQVRYVNGCYETRNVPWLVAAFGPSPLQSSHPSYHHSVSSLTCIASSWSPPFQRIPISNYKFVRLRKQSRRSNTLIILIPNPDEVCIHSFVFTPRCFVVSFPFLYLPVRSLFLSFGRACRLAQGVNE
jgi:hypothetical protein